VLGRIQGTRRSKIVILDDLLVDLGENLSIHPAPIIQPWVPGSSGRTGSDCAA
jgi:hypothetical protein